MTSGDKFGSWESAVVWLREQPEFEQLSREAYYDDPLISAAHRYWESEEWAAVRGLLGPNRGRALDVGAGRGIASYALAKDGYVVSALEPDPSPIVGAQAIRELANSESLSIEVIESYAEQLPFIDNYFDVVFARAVLHHSNDLSAACREYFRVLKSGGRLVAIREHVISNVGDLSEFLASHPLQRLYGGENAFLLDQYLSAIRLAGFGKIATVRPLESAINFAPRTREGLRTELVRRAHKIPGVGRLAGKLLGSEAAFALVLKALSLVDNRPGRLYSFMAIKG